jgi:hypothetical protein
LLATLSDRFERSFSVTNLRNFRQFYLTPPLRRIIRYPSGSKFVEGAGIHYPPGSESFLQKQHTTGADFTILADTGKVIDNVADMLTYIRTASVLFTYSIFNFTFNMGTPGRADWWPTV